MASASSVTLSEGGILDVYESADGTLITGTTELGNTVDITLTNGEQSLTVSATVVGTEFSLTVTPAQLQFLGQGYISIRATATDLDSNTADSPLAGFYYSPNPVVDADDRLDGTGYRSPNDSDDDDAVTSVIPMPDGGFAVQWIADTNGDDDADTFAIQRYDAAGNKDGDVVLLSGFLPEHFADEDYGSALNSLDLTSLAGGGYALTYKLDLFEVDRVASATFNGVVPVSFAIVGQAVEVDIYSAPPGATYFLSGLQGGVVVLTPLTVDDGNIAISREALAAYDFPDRVSIAVQGLTSGQQVSLGIVTLQTRLYDAESVLQVEGRTLSAAPNGFVTLFDLGGRIESFDIDTGSLVSGGGAITYGMTITPALGTQGMSVAGIPNAFINPNGSIFIGNLVPDGNGVIAVPPAILSQLGGNDASILLSIGGLQSGSTVQATVSVREPIFQPQGVFVQAFDADGVASGAPTQLDGPGMWGPNDGEEDGQGLTSVVALANGGFAAQWIADTTNDDDGDTYAIQKFDASGNPDGDVVLLQGIPEFLTDQRDGGAQTNSIDLATLEGGGFALTYKLELSEAGGLFIPVNGGPNPTLISIAGRPGEIDIVSAPAGATFTLYGLQGGVPVSVPLAIGEDNELLIPRELIEQFDYEDRFTLMVSGVPAGQQAQISIGTLQTRLYDSETSLNAEARSLTVGGNGVVDLSAPDGRAEAFDIDSVVPSGANATYTLVINPASGPGPIDITGITGASKTPNFILINGLTPDINGIIAVPPAILSQIGDNDAGISLRIGGLQAGSTVNASVLVREPEYQPEGVFVMTFDENGDPLQPPERLDTADFSGPYDEDGGMVSVFPLSGGGFAVQWIADVTGDGDGDTFAVQRYDASGDKIGGVVVLDMPEIHEDREGGSELSDVDLAPLENGGYALTYKLGLAEIGKFVQLTGNGGPINIGLAGRLVELDVLTAPVGASFAIQGLVGGTLTTVPITVVDGEYDFSPEFLAQFDYPDRVGLVVTGVPLNQQLTLSLGGLQTRLYDGGDPLQTSSLAITAAPNGTAALGASQGRVEAFDIIGVTPVGANPTYILIINPAMGPQSINIAGIPGAAPQPNGNIIVFGVTPNVNGVIAVPPAILSQLGDNDAQISLLIQGLVANSAVTADVLYRAPDYQPEGVYVMTFDGTGQPVTNDLDVVGTEGDDDLLGDDGNDHLDGLGGSDSLAGGEGNDTLDGGTGNDTLDGGAGSDLIYGQSGQDRAVYSGNRADYTVASPGLGGLTVSGTDGSDTLEGVELLEFDDGVYYWSDAAGDLLSAEGVVFDGYLKFATVFVDLNNNGIQDAGEPFTLTDESGNYVLGAEGGPIRATGGINIDTNLPNNLILSAPEGSTVINPLTTLVQALVEVELAANPGADPEQLAADAEAQVQNAFGITFDLTSFDILEAAGNGDTAALEAQKSAASVAEVLNAVQEAGGDSADALDQLAEEVSDGTLDLTDIETLTAIVEAGGVDEAEVAQVVEETHAVTEAIEEAESLDDITDVQGNNAPVANVDQANVNEDATRTGNLLSNDNTGETGPDATDVLTVTSVDGEAIAGPTVVQGAYGTLTIDANGEYSYAANGDILDAYAAGKVLVETFDYAIADGNGGIANSTLTLNVTTINDVVNRSASNGKSTTYSGSDTDDFILGANSDDKINGGAGADQLRGGKGADKIHGGLGIDLLVGGDGADTLIGEGGDDLLVGGAGNDSLSGGVGADIFEFGTSRDRDTVSDFQVGVDFLHLSGVTIAGSSQNGGSTTLNLSNGGSIVLLGVSGVSDTNSLLIGQLPDWADGVSLV